MRFQAALFDLDGTLLDSVDDLADSTNATLAEFGFPTHPNEAYKFFVGNGMKKLATNASPINTPEETILRITDRLCENYSTGWNKKTTIYDGIPELLDALAARGVILGVLSNKPDPFTQVVIKHFFGEKRFAAVFGARPDVPAKPDPAGAKEIAAMLGLHPSQFLYLGDTNTDMRTGISAGMFTVGVSWGFRPVKELVDAGATTIINKPHEALALLE